MNLERSNLRQRNSEDDNIIIAGTSNEQNLTNEEDSPNTNSNCSHSAEYRVTKLVYGRTSYKRLNYCTCKHELMKCSQNSSESFWHLFQPIIHQCNSLGYIYPFSVSINE